MVGTSLRGPTSPSQGLLLQLKVATMGNHFLALLGDLDSLFLALLELSKPFCHGLSGQFGSHDLPVKESRLKVDNFDEGG